MVQFLLPEFLLENFTLTAVDKDGEMFHVRIEERMRRTQIQKRTIYSPKVSFPPSRFRIFQFVDTKVFLHIKRRRWLNTETDKVVYRDWTEVAEGTRMASEFGISPKTWGVVKKVVVLQ